MDDAKTLESALGLIRDKKWEKLSYHAICMRTYIRQKLRSAREQGRANPRQIGLEVEAILRSIMDEMRPPGEEKKNRSGWRKFLILQGHYFDRKLPYDIMTDLAIARPTFFSARKEAIENLLALLANEDFKAERTRVNSLQDQSWEKYRGFYVPRRMEDGREYKTAILEELNSSDIWIFAIVGWPGVGKTKIAYEVGNESYTSGIFESVVAVHIEASKPFSDVLDFIGKELNRRTVKEVDSIHEKYDIIYGDMKSRPTLLILDEVDQISGDFDWDRLISFLEGLPYASSVRVIATGTMRGIFENTFGPGTQVLSFVHTGRVTEYTVEGLQANEGVDFMYTQMQEHKLVPPPKTELSKLFGLLKSGIPAFMRVFVGLINSGLDTKTIVEIFENPEDDPDSTDFPGYDQALYNLMNKVYKRISERDLTAIYVLHVLTIFPSPAKPNAIAAALGLPMKRVAAALGLLYSVFFG